MIEINTKYVEGQIITAWGIYSSGSSALHLLCANTAEVKAAPSLPHVGGYNHPGFVYIKDYGKFDGIMDALIEAGVLRKCGNAINTEQGEVYPCQILNQCL